MINKKRKLGDLLYNNRFLLVFSVCVAVIIWVIVAVEFSPETKVTIKNVPIRVVAAGLDEDSDLQPYGAANLTADITIVGKRYIVEDDKIINDIEVVANTGYVTGAGVHRLTVDVGSISTRPQYEIVDCSVSEIEVMYDKEITKSFIVEPELTAETGKLAADGYFAIVPSPATVKVVGPQTEVGLIEKVVAESVVEGDFTSSAHTTAALTFVTVNDVAPQYCKIQNPDKNIANGQITVQYHIYEETDIRPVLRLTYDGVPLDEEKLQYYGIEAFEIVPEDAVFGIKDGNEPVDGEIFYDLDVSKIAIKNGVYDDTVAYSGEGDSYTVKSENGQKGEVGIRIRITDNTVNLKPVPLCENGEYIYISPLDPSDSFVYEIRNCSTVNANRVEGIYVKGPGAATTKWSIKDLKLDFGEVQEGTTGQVAEIPLVVDSFYSDCWVCDENGDKVYATVFIEE